MKRKEAINYLSRKGKIKGNTTYNKREEAEIDKVIRCGKIYGDPVVEIDR